MVRRVRRQGMRQRRDQQRGFIERQSAGALAEIGLARRLDTPQIRAELRHVQVQREDAVLRQRPLQSVGDHRLLELAERIARGREIEVLRELLGDRAGAAELLPPRPRASQHPTQLLTVACIRQGEAGAPVAQRLPHRPPVHAVMLVERPILRRGRGLPEPVRHGIERNGLVAACGQRVCVLELGLPPLHERRAGGPVRAVPGWRRPDEEQPSQRDCEERRPAGQDQAQDAHERASGRGRAGSA